MERLKFVKLGNSIIQSLSIGILAFSPDMRIIESNKAAEELLQITDRIDTTLAIGTNSKVWNNWKEQLTSVMREGKISKYDNISYQKGETIKLFDITCLPLREEESPNIIGGTIVIEDVTQKVTIERQLASLERLAAIGKIAGKVAHELNNPMDGIIRYLNLSKRVIDQNCPEKAHEYLDNCKAGLLRMTEVIKELLEYARSSKPSNKNVKLEEVLKESLKVMSAHINRAHVAVDCELSEMTNSIRCNSLFQVFCNLIKNAVDAMSEGGTLKIKSYIDDQGHNVIQFSDTGHGIEEEHLETIFEPFFTTKQQGKGTGLGLSICNDIVTGCGGKITAENNKEGGSTFRIILPSE